MKGVSSIKSNVKNESPKTPGGISKSLLTPCRRVGLSRSWKKKGPSPFISPLGTSTSTSETEKEDKKETRKRKSVVSDCEESETSERNQSLENQTSTPIRTADVSVKTPLRSIELPQRKKSKSLLVAIHEQEDKNDSIEIGKVKKIHDSCDTSNVASFKTPIENNNTNNSVVTKQDDAIQKESSNNANIHEEEKGEDDTFNIESICGKENKVAKPKKKKSESKHEKSPNQLSKECIVVIQRKLLKVKEKYDNKMVETSINQQKEKPISQVLFDSDSDDLPLCALNKTENKKQTVDDEDEFMNEKKKQGKIDNIKTIAASTTKTKTKVSIPKSKVQAKIDTKPSSQSSFDDDDDDFFDKKKTILIRKTYEKVVKPLKAKSTGSITQKDIDDLRGRIEVKKKMLLARAMTSETEELRGLIKKWQKGCQDALVELMDLMKIKCPDKHNMDYSEMLQMLKIPPALVGYDSDNDCFNTPDDASAVLSKFKDL